MTRLPYYRPHMLTKGQQDAVLDKARDVLVSRQFTKGRNVNAFEYEVAFRTGATYAIATSSGTMALYIAARALRDAFGYKTVQLPVYSYISTAEAFKMAGYEVILCDVDIETFQLVPRSGESDVICGVDTFGSYWKPVGKAKVYMVDAAQSFGTYRVGGGHDFREVECFSFTGSKIIPAGEGGAIVTSNQRLYSQMLQIRDWAGRMSELQAILGLQYMLTISNILETRELVAGLWHKNFEEVNWQKIPMYTNYYAIAGLSEDREQMIHDYQFDYEFKKYWAEPQIETYNNFPGAKYIAERIICFPVNPDALKEEEEEE